MMTSTENAFAIKTDTFEGPLELLLELIEKRKLLINDISLAEVTDEYMAHVAEMQEHPVQETAQFVLVASTLLLIKSKSLLPVLDLTSEDEENIGDLEHRLRLYQIYRDAGRGIQKKFGQRILYSRTFIPSEQPIFTPDAYTQIDVLTSAIREIITNLPRKEQKKTVAVAQVISLEEVMERLHARIANKFKTTFREFSGSEQEKRTVIVSFLAVLELVKQGVVMVRQEQRYADFDIERESSRIPQQG